MRLSSEDEDIWVPKEQLTPKFTKETTYVDANRKGNVIIHGLCEGENDDDLVKDTFLATATLHTPVTTLFLLIFGPFYFGPLKFSATPPQFGPFNFWPPFTNNIFLFLLIYIQGM